MALSPTAVHDTAQAVLGCVCAALDQVAETIEGQPGCPDCNTCVVPGSPAWDRCDGPCEEGTTQGQLSVSVLRMYPTSMAAFPNEDTKQVQGIKNCTLPQLTAVEILVTLLRCAPVDDDEGCPPTCEEFATAAKILHVDATTVYNAVLCCFPDTSQRRRGQMFVIGQQKVVGPQGQCVGIEQRLTVALPSCKCPDVTEETP